MTEPTHDFEIIFDPRMSEEEVAWTMEALADFWRSCGGAGFDVEFDREAIVPPRGPES